MDFEIGDVPTSFRIRPTAANEKFVLTPEAGSDEERFATRVHVFYASRSDVLDLTDPDTSLDRKKVIAGRYLAPGVTAATFTAQPGAAVTAHVFPLKVTHEQHDRYFAIVRPGKDFIREVNPNTTGITLD